jgi:outer membrane protein OmpA-like peptidoglycan-associated protein
MRLASRLSYALLLVLCGARATASGQSDGIAINRFDPASSGSHWFSGESLDFRGHLRPAAGLTLDWAHDPLVLYDADGDAITSIVGDQVFAHLGGALVLWDRVRVGLDLPLQLAQSGDTGTIGGVALGASGDAAFGDVRLGGDVRLYGAHRDVVTVAAGLQLHLPTGSRDAYTSDGALRVVPRVMVAGELERFVYSARASVNVRAQDDGLGNIPTGSELAFVATAGMRVLDAAQLLVGPELWGSTVFEDFFAEATTPFELILAGHYDFQDFVFGLGAGPGLTRGFGAPAVRVLASVEWSPDIEPKQERVVEPEPAPVPEPQPEPAAAPEPPPDRDGDGVVDDEDACPDTPGIHTDDPQTHGCPGDRDRDAIVDPDDACPDAAGEPNSDRKKHGCPRARVEQEQIKIIDRIEFETNQATIRPDSEPALEAVRKILEEHPEIQRLAVEGHTDNVGKPAYNEKLSQRRAAAVVTWLVGRGIGRSRLESHGYGMQRPIADNGTEEGRQENRRVEFHIKKSDGGGDAEEK